MAGRYKILEQLGAGGLGAVFKAYDTQLNRYVAIKRLLSKEELEKEDDQSGGLRQEAASLSALQHPNIVSIFDLANDDEGFFIVMELLEGETLGDWIKKGSLALREFHDLATQTLEAILTAHHQSILHRDLKPDNIKMLRLPGGRLQVKVLDFGLARQSYGARKMTEDQKGNIMGSIYYMSPEQLLRNPVDGRTDLYALGCLFYQLLSGRRPFEGESVHEIMDRHLNHQVYPLHEIAPQIPGPICDWVMWLINLDPQHRPANAQQALASLREIHDAGWFKPAPVVDDTPLAVLLEDEAPAPVQLRQTTGQNPPRITGSLPRKTSTGVPAASTPAPAGFVRTATGSLVPVGGNPVKARPAPPVVVEPPKKKLPVWLWPAVGVVVLLAGWMFWPKKASPPAATTATAPAAATATTPSNVRPADLLLPNGLLHYVAGQKMDPYAAASAKPGEIVKSWHDLLPLGADGVLTCYDLARETCPKYLLEKVDGFKTELGFLRFDQGKGMMHEVKSGVSGSGYPLGSSGKKGVTFFILVRPNITGKEQTCLLMMDPDRMNSISVRATPANEFKLIIAVGATKKEAKVTGRNAKAFNLVSVIWDAVTNKALLTVRTQDGSKSRAEMDAPKGTDFAALTQLRLSRSPEEKAPAEELFTGDVAELVVWPYPMTWEDRNLQDWKYSQYYFANPGSRY